jgi:hypothetical protein
MTTAQLYANLLQEKESGAADQFLENSENDALLFKHPSIPRIAGMRFSPQ